MLNELLIGGRGWHDDNDDDDDDGEGWNGDMMMLDLQFIVDCHFMICIISLYAVSLLWLGSSANFPPMCTKEFLMVLDDFWISWVNLYSSVAEKYRLFMELMHLLKDSDILNWRRNFLVAVFFAVIYFRLFHFSPICSHLSTFYQFNSGEVYSRS